MWTRRLDLRALGADPVSAGRAAAPLTEERVVAAVLRGQRGVRAAAARIGRGNLRVFITETHSADDPLGAKVTATVRFLRVGERS